MFSVSPWFKKFETRTLSIKVYNLKLSFTKTRVNRDEIIDALEAILRELRSSKS